MTCQEYINDLLNTYTLISTLADKNGCKTLRLRHKTLNRDLVLRQLPQEIEAYRLLCGIKASALPEVYDAVSLQDGQVVLEEYIDGLTVAEVMETGCYRYKGAKKVLAALCNAMTILHQYGLVHRDIKPENVMVTPNGRAVLVDLNASRRVKPHRKDTVIMGTVGYASPEQLGIAQSDARTDIYATGVLLNVMITGKHPSEKLAGGRPGRIVKKCTHVNPNDRFQTAEKLLKAL